MPGLAPEPESDRWRRQLKGYFAAVTAMDANIGRIIDLLDRRGLRDDTLVVFLGDNGFSTGHHGLWGKGSSSFPLNIRQLGARQQFSTSREDRRGPALRMVSAIDFPHAAGDARAGDAKRGRPADQSFAHLLSEDSMRGHGTRRIVVFDEYGPVRMIGPGRGNTCIIPVRPARAVRPRQRSR